MTKEYVQRVADAMRFYSRNCDALGSILFKDRSSVLDWTCCELTLKEFRKRDREILIAIYSADKFNDAVKWEAEAHEIEESSVRAMNRRFLARFGVNRVRLT